jgi:prevent-host-death family protein
MAKTVNIHDAKTNLSRILEQVEKGETVVIARAGTPIADLVPHRERSIAIGTLKGRIHVEDDAFSWPDPEIARMFYGDDDPA